MADDVASLPDPEMVARDAERARLVPYLDAMQEIVLALLPEPRERVPYRVLDLGAGTGLLAERILAVRPAAELTLVDFSETALATARKRLYVHDSRVHMRAEDYAHMDYGGPYDAIVAELSVHHLNPKAMQTMFSAAFAALRRGGRFINADQIRASTETLEELYLSVWRRDALQAGAEPGELAEAIERHREARPPTLERLLDWLSGDGYEDVACHYKRWGFAVMAGDKR